MVRPCVIFVNLLQVYICFRGLTHPISALGCGCKIIQYQGIVPVQRMRCGHVSWGKFRYTNLDVS